MKQKALVASLLLVLLILGLRPYADLSIIIAAGDNLFNMYVLEHGWLWLTGQVDSFWNAPFFYPTENVLAYSDCHLGNLPFYALIRSLAQDRIVAFQYWTLLSAALNYLAACWALRKFNVHWIMVGLGAYLFAFSLPVIAQNGHLQMLPRFLVPLAFVFAAKWVREARMRDFALLIACGVGQVYVSVYTGFFLFLLVGVFLLVGIIQNRTDLRIQPRLPGYLSLIGIGSAGILAVLPLGIPYYHASKVVGQRSWEEVSEILPRPASWVFPAWDSALYGDWAAQAGFRELPFWWEQQLFFGLIPMLGLVFAVAFTRKLPIEVRNLVVALLSSIVIAVLVSTMWGAFSFYQFLYGLPGIGALRGVSRVIVVMLFPIGLLLSLSSTQWLASGLRLGGRGRLATHVAAVVISLLFVAEQQPKKLGGMEVSKLRGDLQVLVAEIEALKEEMALKAVWIRQDNAWDYQEEVLGMLATQTAGVPLLTGYSGWTPPQFDLTSQETPPSINAAERWLDRNGIASLDGIGLIGPASQNDDDRYALVHWVVFSSDYAAFQRYAKTGWHAPEDWGVWSDGERSVIELSLEDAPLRSLALQVESKAFVFDGRPTAETEVYVNGQNLGQIDYTIWEPTKVSQLSIPSGVLRAGVNLLEFRHQNVKSPAQYGINDDRRELSMGLLRFRIFDPNQAKVKRDVETIAN